MKNSLLLLLLLCSAQSAFCSIHFRHLGKSDGLSQLSVMSICQDELGRMWFGTLEGLNCYDGERITSFKASPQYPMLGNEIFNVVTDKQGSLFFTSDSMLILYDLYQEKFTRLREKGVSTLFARDNQVWMATNDSIFQWNHAARRFNYLLSHPSIHRINCLQFDPQQHLWVGTRRGLYRFEKAEKGVRPTCIIPQTQIESLYNDSHGNLWVAAFRNGFYKIAPGSQPPYAREILSLSSNDVRNFMEDSAGNLWIATFNGFNRVAPDGNITCYKKDNLPGSLQHSSIFPLYKDVQGNIWLGTFYGGAHYFNPVADLFTHYAENADRDDCLSFFFVGKMAEDKKGDLWICTEGGGLNHLERHTGKFTHYLADGKPGSIPFNNLKCIAYDETADRLFIGTHTRGFFCLDIPTGKIAEYTDLKTTGSIVTQIALYKDKLYFHSNLGLRVMDMNTKAVTSALSGTSFSPDIQAFTIDSKGYLWGSQTDRLFCLNLNNPKETRSYLYKENGLGKFSVTAILVDRKGKLYLGTNGSGLFCFDPMSGTFTQYTAKDGWLQSNYCYDFALSRRGYLIVSGEQGITFFDPQQKNTKKVGLNSKLALSALNEGCGLLVCRDGEVFIGGTDGMTSFKEDKLFDDVPPYKMYFSSLSVNNQPISPEGSDILSQALPFSKEVSLRHNENNIILTFTSNNYLGSLQQNGYEYKLEGFDTHWVTSVDKKIVYTNLNPGSYTLIVREKEPNGAGQTIRLHIRIHSPWYSTWWAYASYLILLTVVAGIFIRNRRTKMLLQHSLELEKRNKEKNEEIIQAKLQFFANISHEFRTPLTLIISQIEMLIQYKGLSPFLHTRLLKIYRNTFQLRELISELLDFRKLERGGMQLKVSRMNLIPYLRTIYEEFQGQATLQSIDFRFQSAGCETMAWCDAKQFKKVISNLLSNAFKYTPEGGKVDLIIEDTEESILIKIADTGQGIAKEALPHIFERFYQSGTSVSKEPGTGIGLALTKGIVELHHGDIEAHSAPGYGSIFIVALPKANVFAGDEHVTITDAVEQLSTTLRAASTNLSPMTDEEIAALPTQPTDESPEEKACILLVEDNEDLLQILTDLLAPMYRIVIAMNGKDGLEKTREEMPDLILSDIMMPVMSGTEMCRKIKNDFDLCHIPLMLLTALTSEDKNIEGLQCGADDYIGKPFSNRLLISKIASTLRNRNLLKRKYGQLMEGHQPKNELQELALNPIDQKFLTQLNQVIEAHLSDPEFDVNLMAKKIGVSRSSLYNKLKALSCMTPNEFILNTRLKQAAGLLKNHPELQITEIAYQVGFNSLRYFRHCFKTRFNQTPQEYRSNRS